jgi:hypothetical protein
MVLCGGHSDVAPATKEMQVGRRDIYTTYFIFASSKTMLLQNTCPIHDDQSQHPFHFIITTGN